MWHLVGEARMLLRDRCPTRNRTRTRRADSSSGRQTEEDSVDPIAQSHEVVDTEQSAAVRRDIDEDDMLGPVGIGPGEVHGMHQAGEP